MTIATAPSLRVLRLREWETKTFEGLFLSDAARAVARRLSEGEGRLEIEELREGTRVTAHAWVGVVRLDSCEVRIVPKLAGGQLGLVQLLEIVSGLDGLRRILADASLDVSGEHLLDLVAILFAEACEDVVRRGLLAGYLEREEYLPVVRGRILADRQILERYGKVDQVCCRFDELEQDVDENRVLAATLRAVTRRVVSQQVHRRLARLRAVFEQVCDADRVDLLLTRDTIVYNRLNNHYRRAHELAWLLLDGLGIEDLISAGTTESFGFLIDMNLLFERFVEQLVHGVLRGLPVRVQRQAVRCSIITDAVTRRPHGHVRPDILVESTVSPGARLSIDAKYKLYDEHRPDVADIYQGFLYALAIGERRGNELPASLILYPSSTGANEPVHLCIRSLTEHRLAEIHVIGVPIPQALAEMVAGASGPVCTQLQGLILGRLGFVNK